MRKISLRTVQKLTEANETLVLLVPFNVSDFSSKEYSRLVDALGKVDFLRSHSSRLTIRLAAWDAVEAAFDGYRVRVIPDEKQPAEKYADIHFSIEAKDE
jgi:hypothetical protein